MKDDETPPTEGAAPIEVLYVDHIGGRRRMVAVPEVGIEECGPDETSTMRVAFAEPLSLHRAGELISGLARGGGEWSAWPVASVVVEFADP